MFPSTQKSCTVRLHSLPLLGYLFAVAVIVHDAASFTTVNRTAKPLTFSRNSVLHVLSNKSKLTSLPPGVSPFEKAVAKRSDIQGTFRAIATQSLSKALQDKKQLLEIDVPPFIGGDQSKNQFDDYDNIQELDANRDWCVQWVPQFASKINSNVWLIFPDDKECELAKKEWTGQRFRKNMKFTSIRAVCETMLNENAMTSYKKAWGSSFAESINKLQGGDGILADSSTLDQLDVSDTNRLHLVCQPGNGGPVEDWINVEQIHRSSSLQEGGGATIVVNGALDKVRDGYYPALFFPALAKTVPFYRQFEPILFAKPLSDKGYYGWLYRVYPEPWQVILQVARPSKKPNDSTIKVEDIVALVTDRRPSYEEAINAMVRTAAEQSTA